MGDVHARDGTDSVATHPVAPELPPGPGTFGSLRFARSPVAFLESCARRYGDWFTVRVPGFPPFVFTSAPQAIREIFAGDPNLLYAGEANAPLGAFMGPHSVLLLDGAAHLRERRLLLPPFHGERMQAYGAAIQQITDRAIDDWPLGQPFPLHQAMQAITFDVILSTVFGFDDVPERTRLGGYFQQVFRMFGSPLGSLLGLPALQIDLGPLSPWGRVVRLRRTIETILYEEFARRRRAGLAGRTDVLSLLLAVRDEHGEPMSDAVLHDEMVTLLLAGHETTAASLAWVFARLLEHPAVVAQLREELRRIDGAPQRVNELAYLDAVIKETSRLDPVIPNVGRRLQAPMVIAGRALPKGPIVAPCIYLAHRRADLWSDPERFEPERFLGTRTNPAAFFPFGGGVRRCLGAAFATYEMKVVIARVLARVDLAAAPGYRMKLVRRSIAFAPSEGLPVVATSRK